jgi:LPS-assembly protein
VTPLASVAAAALLAGLTASPFGPLPAATGELTIQAPQVVCQGDGQVCQLSGGVVVRRGAVVLRARSATVHQDTGEVQATGDVLLVDATRVLHADGVHALLDGPFQASQVIGFEKAEPLRLERATTLAEARRGRNRLTFSADQVEGDGAGRLQLRRARFTLCDCGEGKAPTWELGASRAEVAGDRVALSWPVLYVTPRFLLVQRPVPVLVLPWLSLPLRDRQTGLLFPEAGSTRTLGAYLAVPVFVTLGRSADATVAPELFLGPASRGNPGGAVRGPGVRLELRWAPAERAEGLVQVHLVQDADRERIHGGAQPGGKGLRLSLEGEHAQGLGEGTRLSAQLSLSQDPFMFRDFHGNAMPRDAAYARSAAVVSRARDAWVLEASAAYLEPLVSIDGGSDGGSWRPGAFGWFGLQAPAAQRWPSLSAALLPAPLGPLLVEGRTGLSRFAPLAGHRGELLPTDHGYLAARAGGLLDASAREAVTRGDARLQLSAPFLLADAVALAPFVRGVLVGYGFDDGPRPAATAWGVAGLDASAELARDLGPLEHRISPRLALLGGTAPAWSRRGDPSPSYDAWDRLADVGGGAAPAQTLSAAPGGAYTQLRASLENLLDAGPAGQLRLELGQDLDLRRGRLAESFGALSGSRGPLRTDAAARMLLGGGRPAVVAPYRRSWLDAFTQLHLGAAAHDRRGDALTASLDATGAGAVGVQGAGVDALFDLRSNGLSPDASCTLGARAVLGGATLDYRIKLAARYLPSVGTGGNGTVAREAGRPLEQVASLAWDSPCHCFVARAVATLDAQSRPSFRLDVDLSRMLQGAGGKGAAPSAAPQ